MEQNIVRYDGRPSIILPQRPFLSVVVACYNSRKTLGVLLESINQQHMNDQIEVILSDDCSTESYQDIVDAYKSILSIRQVQTDYNFAPGNTREKGVSIAEGQWICFADHDDEFIPDTLPRIRDNIIASGEQKFAIANFLEVNPDTNTIMREMRRTRNWNHAKFYNLDNLWKACNIHFKKDLLTHEDIYISSIVNCLVPENEILFIDEFCYIWNCRPTSVSREIYGEGHQFVEQFFDDYVESTGRTYLKLLNEGIAEPMYALNQCINVILYCYFYIISFMFHNPVNWIRDNERIAREYLIQIKEKFNITNEFIWNYAASNDAALYCGVRDSAYIATGPYIEKYTLIEFLDLLHKDIVPLVPMSNIMKKEGL